MINTKNTLWVAAFIATSTLLGAHPTPTMAQSKGVFGRPSQPGASQGKPTAAAPPAVQTSAMTAASSDEFSRPKYQILRQNEDWSGLGGHDTANTGDKFDPIKHIALSPDGTVWASLGGHLRVRTESWGRFGFGGAPNDDDGFTLVRLQLHSDLHFGENVRVFIEGKSALSTERDLVGGRRTLDDDNLELEQAFLDVAIPLEDDAKLTIRAGRQALVFGKQRLVSNLPWSNTQRQWDGVSGILETSSGWKVSGFYTKFAPVQKFEFNDADSQTEFSGIYATNAKDGVDLYWLFLDQSDTTNTYNGTTGDEQRHTLGARVWGKSDDGVTDYDLEAAYQTGKVGTADIRAFMVGTEVGARLGEEASSPRIHLGFDYASGDQTAGDGTVETFNQLFPLGHAYLGYIDTIGRQNIIDLSSGITLKPIKKLVVKVTGHLFWRANDSDSLYNAGGGIARATVTKTSHEVGSEIDLLVKYGFTPHLSGMFGYSRFYASDFLEQTGAHSDIDFFYASLKYTF